MDESQQIEGGRDITISNTEIPELCDGHVSKNSLIISSMPQPEVELDESEAEERPINNSLLSQDLDSCSDDDVNMDQSKDEGCTSKESLRLDELPMELLLHILSYLSAPFITKSLSKVCRRFRNLSLDQNVWKVRLHRTFPGGKHPPIPVEEFDWRKACVDYDRENKRWSSALNESSDFYQIKSCISAAVDTVHLMQKGRFLATGSRDKYLNIIDLSRLDPLKIDYPDPSCCVVSKPNAHGGWIWSISSVDNILATGSWDRYVKFWDIKTMSEISNVRTNSAVICTHFESGFMAVGSYDKFVYHIDPRTSAILCKKRYHTRPVLCMASEDGYIVTGSEDSSVVVYDRRASKVIKNIKVSDYPMSLSYKGSELWVGDKAGQVSLFDARYGNFNLVGTFDIGHSFKVTGLLRTDGVLFTASMDHTVKALQPSLPPCPLTTLNPHTSEIAEISYENNVLACACSGQCVSVYIPKHFWWD